MKKEEMILQLFFNEPTKHWHFEEILREARISRPQATKWLKEFAKAGLIKRLKHRGLMPFYVGNCEKPAYQVKKRLYALNKLESAGFLRHLASLPKAHTVIIFGSFSRWDWFAESDIDVFVYGAPEGLDVLDYRLRLRRAIELFVCKDETELQKFKPEFLRNIAEGFLVKGDLDFLRAAYA